VGYFENFNDLNYPSIVHILGDIYHHKEPEDINHIPTG